MNGFDIALLGFAAVALLLGLLNGLVRILIGLVALLAAFMVAAQYHEALAARMPSFGAGPEARGFAAYVVIFFGIMLVAGLVAWLVRRLVQAAKLGWADRLGGAALGLLAASLFAAFVVVPIVAYAPAGRALLADSRLAPYVAVVADLALRLAPAPLASRYDEHAEELRRGWRERLVVARSRPRIPSA